MEEENLRDKSLAPHDSIPALHDTGEFIEQRANAVQRQLGGSNRPYRELAPHNGGLKRNPLMDRDLASSGSGSAPHGGESFHPENL